MGAPRFQKILQNGSCQDQDFGRSKRTFEVVVSCGSLRLEITRGREAIVKLKQMGLSDGKSFSFPETLKGLALTRLETRSLTKLKARRCQMQIFPPGFLVSRVNPNSKAVLETGGFQNKLKARRDQMQIFPPGFLRSRENPNSKVVLQAGGFQNLVAVA
ncbi:hypothetical protein J6590_048075 [Homalodisca vitripennis]|nr:hypothetical protein J6590_048075 [Homalodisca vitripennis]